MEVFSVFATLSLADMISGPLGGIQSSMRNLEGDVGSLSTRMGNLTLSMAPVALAAGALLGVFGIATSAAMKFESAMADVAKVVSFESQAEFTAMSDTVKELSGRIPMAADGIAAIIAAAGQSGVAKADLAEFAEQAAKMGVAFDLTGDQAGKMMSDWRAGMNLTVPQTYALADATNYLSNNMNATAPALGEVIQRVGAAAMACGLAETQVAALGASFLSAGASPEVAATALKKFTTTLVKGTAMSKDQAAAFSGLGFSVTQMAKDMQTDAQGTIFKVLQAIADKPKELQMSLLTEMFGEEAIGAIAPLLQNMGLLSQSFELVGNKSKYAGSMQAEFEARSKTTENALQLLSNKLTNLAISVGNVFLPAVAFAANLLGTFADAVRFVVDTPFGQWIIGVAGGISALLLGITALSAAMWSFSAVGPMLARGLAPLKAALLGLGAPFWVLIAVSGALYLAYKSNFAGIADTLNRWWKNISLVVRGVIAVFQNLTGSVGEIKGELATEIKAAGLVGLVTAVGRIVFRIKAFFSGMMDAVNDAMGPIDEILLPVRLAVAELMLALGELFGGMDTEAVGGATSAWAGFGKLLGGLVGDALTYTAKGLALLVEGIRFVIDGALSLAERFSGSVVGAFERGAGVFVGVGQRLQSFYKGVWNMFSRGMEIVGQTAGRVFSRMGDVFSSVIRLGENIGTAFSRIGEALAPLLARIFGGEITTGTSAWETFGTILGGTVALAVNLVATGLGIIVNGVNMLVNGLTFVVAIFTGDIPAAAGAFRAILESWGEGFALIGDLFGVGDSIRGAWAEVMGFFDSINLFESGAKLMATFADGIKSLAMAPLEAVTNALTWVRDLLPFSDAKTGPLSTLTLSGTRMMTTLGEGVTAGAPTLLSRVSGAFDGVKDTLAGWWSSLTGGEIPAPVMPEMPAVATPRMNAMPVLPASAVQQVSVAQVAPVTIPDAPAFVPEVPRNGDQQDPSQSRGRNPVSNITISIANLNLPNVKDGKSFTEEMQGLTAEYNGVPA